MAFRSLKRCYQTNTWDQELVSSANRHAFLVKNNPPVTEDRNAVTWVDKGLVFACRGDLSDAIQALNEATDLDPTHSTAWSLKSYCLYKQGRYQESLQSIEKFLELAPNEPYELYNKGVLLQELGQTEDAAQAFQSARQYGCGYDDLQYHWNLNCQDFQKDLETRLGMDATTAGPEQQDQTVGTMIPLEPQVGCHRDPITYQVICYDDASLFSNKSNAQTTSSNNALSIGDRVRTTSDKKLNVRTDPGTSSPSIGTMVKGSMGIIIDGPVFTDNLSWWKIQYDTGITGWSSGKWLELAP